MTAADRAARAEAADALCAAAYEKCAGPDSGVALVAVGGYGRGELAPYSDLDVVLVHDVGVELATLAEEVWYPIWDAGARLDHAVRSLPEMVEAAAADHRVASGLLDARHLAGDPALTLRLRTTMLAEWRRGARERLPESRRAMRERHRVIGELAHRSVPDLKEAAGGLRDATALRGVVATWLVDVPHTDLERARQVLLDVRDVVHEVAGRATDRIAPEIWEPLGEALGLGVGEVAATAAQRRVREAGRLIAHLNRLAWRRIDGVLARPASGRARRPLLESLAPGVALSGGEVVLDRRADPAADPLLLLRAAAEAAERGVALAPSTAARLVREGAALPDPWPEEARRLLVRLLAAGPGLLEVWETLEETGALRRLLPEWERVRLLPHASAIHRFTVDRHLVETCIEASSLIRTVGRPDVLLVAALLHDIGKGGLLEHSVAGEPIARAAATRMGFDAEGVDLVAFLVRRHLLLASVATTRDPDDPATVDLITGHVPPAVPAREALALLLALTEADARATAPQAWTSWRAGLVRTLAVRADAVVSGDQPPFPDPRDLRAVPIDPDRDSVAVAVEPGEDGTRVTVAAADRVGLLADLAATFALLRMPIRSARVWTHEEWCSSTWELAVDPLAPLDPALVRRRFAAVSGGRVDLGTRFGGPRPAGEPEPGVVVRPEASRRSTVLEVRAADRPGVVHLVCAALARLDVTIASAHVETLGPQAVDVFYLRESAAGALSEPRSAAVAHAVREALGG